MVGLPIAILNSSERFLETVGNLVESNGQREILVADYASGENEEIPLFMHHELPRALDAREIRFSSTVYCIDLHTLRIESLYSKLKEMGLIKNTRIVVSKFEKMISEAHFPETQIEYMNCLEKLNSVDEQVLRYNKIPKGCFDIGILNNDVIGYIHSYYKEYTNSEASMKGFRETMHGDGLLIVTQPCMLYPVDNIAFLESHGFNFIWGIDFNSHTSDSIEFDRRYPIERMSRLGHYTVLLFECDT